MVSNCQPHLLLGQVTCFRTSDLAGIPKMRGAASRFFARLLRRCSSGAVGDTTDSEGEKEGPYRANDDDHVEKVEENYDAQKQETKQQENYRMLTTTANEVQLGDEDEVQVSPGRTSHLDLNSRNISYFSQSCGGATTVLARFKTSSCSTMKDDSVLYARMMKRIRLQQQQRNRRNALRYGLGGKVLEALVWVFVLYVLYSVSLVADFLALAEATDETAVKLSSTSLKRPPAGEKLSVADSKAKTSKEPDREKAAGKSSTTSVEEEKLPGPAGDASTSPLPDATSSSEVAAADKNSGGNNPPVTVLDTTTTETDSNQKQRRKENAEGDVAPGQEAALPQQQSATSSTSPTSDYDAASGKEQQQAAAASSGGTPRTDATVLGRKEQENKDGSALLERSRLLAAISNQVTGGAKAEADNDNGPAGADDTKEAGEANKPAKKISSWQRFKALMGRVSLPWASSAFANTGVDLSAMLKKGDAKGIEKVEDDAEDEFEKEMAEMEQALQNRRETNFQLKQKPVTDGQKGVNAGERLAEEALEVPRGIRYLLHAALSILSGEHLMENNGDVLETLHVDKERKDEFSRKLSKHEDERRAEELEEVETGSVEKAEPGQSFDKKGARTKYVASEDGLKADFHEPMYLQGDVTHLKPKDENGSVEFEQSLRFVSSGDIWEIVGVEDLSNIAKVEYNVDSTESGGGEAKKTTRYFPMCEVLVEDKINQDNVDMMQQHNNYNLPLDLSSKRYLHQRALRMPARLRIKKLAHRWGKNAVFDFEDVDGQKKRPKKGEATMEFPLNENDKDCNIIGGPPAQDCKFSEKWETYMNLLDEYWDKMSTSKEGFLGRIDIETGTMEIMVAGFEALQAGKAMAKEAMAKEEKAAGDDQTTSASAALQVRSNDNAAPAYANNVHGGDDQLQLEAKNAAALLSTTTANVEPKGGQQLEKTKVDDGSWAQSRPVGDEPPQQHTKEENVAAPVSTEADAGDPLQQGNAARKTDDGHVLSGATFTSAEQIQPDGSTTVGNTPERDAPAPPPHTTTQAKTTGATQPDTDENGDQKQHGSKVSKDTSPFSVSSGGRDDGDRKDSASDQHSFVEKKSSSHTSSQAVPDAALAEEGEAFALENQLPGQQHAGGAPASPDPGVAKRTGTATTVQSKNNHQKPQAILKEAAIKHDSFYDDVVDAASASSAIQLQVQQSSGDRSRLLAQPGDSHHIFAILTNPAFYSEHAHVLSVIFFVLFIFIFRSHVRSTLTKGWNFVRNPMNLQRRPRPGGAGQPLFHPDQSDQINTPPRTGSTDKRGGKKNKKNRQEPGPSHDGRTANGSGFGITSTASTPERWKRDQDPGAGGSINNRGLFNSPSEEILSSSSSSSPALSRSSPSLSPDAENPLTPDTKLHRKTKHRKPKNNGLKITSAQKKKMQGKKRDLLARMNYGERSCTGENERTKDGFGVADTVGRHHESYGTFANLFGKKEGKEQGTESTRTSAGENLV
ncbi:unnamed protein product [Amoebophrya sp. A120]|nr:unnamed protein product [Amoebophrya sp. A120]|eukprot:GSA120T00013593001.1